jgi:O-methyltransferase
MINASDRLAPLIRTPRTWWAVKKVRDAGLETIVDFERLLWLQRAARKCLAFEGDYAEFGSYRGGSAGVIGLELIGSNKKLHVCDSFRGMPSTSAQDNFHQQGDFAATSAARVRKGLADLRIPAIIHPGFFSETIPKLPDTKLAFVHIDADLYESVRDCLQYCYPRMLAGTVIIFDDYGAPTCEGARSAVDEFFVNRTEVPEQLTADSWGVLVGHKGGLQTT